ncbi:MAG: restriction endonuclease subunit S [Pusillimonas sp.]
MNEVIPEGWGQKKLGEVATLTMGQSPSSHTYNFAGKGLPFFQGKADFSAREAVIRSWCSEPTKTAPAGSILFSVRAPVGETNIAPKECCVGRGLAAIIAKKTDQEFLFQYLRYSKPQFEAVSQGSTFEAINGNELKEFMLLHPPLPEQQKIATILSSVDDVIEKTRAQIDKLKDLKTGMMQELLTQGIGHTEFKDSPVGRIPASWRITDLRSVVIKDGLQTGPFGSQLHAHEYIEWGVPVVMPKDMSNNRMDTSSIARISSQKANELKKHSVRSGDILFSRRGDIGRFVLINKKDEGAICGTGCLRVRLSEIISPFYLACYLTLSNVVEWLNANAVGQTMLNLNTSILGNLPVVLPSKSEQVSIGQTIIALEEKIQLKSAKLLALEKLKKALMQDLLTGKVRVKPDPTEVAAA